MVPFFLTWGFHTPPACFFFSFLGFPLWQRFAILQIFLRTIFARTTTKSLKTLPAPPPFEKKATNSSKIKNKQVFYIFFYVMLSSEVKIDFFAISVAPRSPGGFLPQDVVSMVRSVKCLVNLLKETNASPRDATTTCHRGVGFSGRRSAWGYTKTSVVVLVVGFWMRLFLF